MASKSAETLDPVLVTGGTGQVGSATLRVLREAGVAACAPSRADLDLLDEASIKAFLARNRCRAVIHCAAFTAVDRAEDEADLADAINARAPAVLAAETARLGLPIIHLSTDYVFGGTKPGLYKEDDETNPLGVYGRTKLAGETAVRAANPNHAIIRTAWVLSAWGSNFLNTMLRLGADRDDISVVDDQCGCPTSATDIAHALFAVLSALGDRGGTWHFVNSGSATWFALAEHIFSLANQAGQKTPRLHAISTAAYPTKARRPANSRLSTDLIARDFGLEPRDWREAVRSIMAEKFPASVESEQ
ncbi:MAG: dTDP-4-dehydrorhamnose reductase [Sphingopyxis sp.]|uniref:dTDP-4-dehydrorhamnose reductase n=1 Tax=Sphingopyxis sp. TaxID=1908224 RepID=UPI001A5D66F6|nr:dTDP-4-dehydrorhamnose reductase [Sphingopyxis sp.]MBL9071706.1 dTDP-4-dehydrorhamnose reductase [Sphingopyxis sp.]